MTDDYVNLFRALQSENLNGSALLAMMLLALGRLFPIIALAPFLGGKLLPHPVKVALGLSLFAMLLPKLMVTIQTPLGFNAMLILLVMKEVLIGWLLGILINLPFWAAQIGGLYVDHQRGGASLMIQDPSIQSQSSPIGTLYNYVLIYLFFMVDGPFLFLQAVFTSFDVLPPDQFMAMPFFSERSEIWGAIISLFGRCVILGVQLASPALLVILMTDMFLGIINRLAPQVMITFLGLPLKSLLGLAVIAIGWKLLTSQIVREALKWVQELQGMIGDLAIGIG